MNIEQQYVQAQQLLAKGDYGSAYKLLKKLDGAVPNHPGILYLLGACQSLGGNKKNAISSYLRAIKLQPDFIEAHNNAGLDLFALGLHQEALKHFDQAIKINPVFKEASINRASTLISLHRLNEAISELESLLKLHPKCPKVLANIGNAFAAASKHEAALGFYESALAVTPNDSKILGYKVSMLDALGLWDECIKNYNLLLPDAPERFQLLGSKVHAQLKINDWSDFPIESDFIDKNRHPLRPLTFLYFCNSQSYQLSNARQFSETFCHGAKLSATDNKKIKIGYVSADFRDHPIGYLTAGLFGSHDHTAFEIYCFSSAPPDVCQGAISERIRNKCDKFVYLDQLSDSDAIELIRSFRLDVAFDLGGYTSAARTNLFAARIAPIQISYLGFPGSMGTTFIDYLIGDPIVIPKKLYKLYLEKIISLPESFQANDDLRRIIPMARNDEGLPEDALVLACFNQSAKITPSIFKIWMNSLLSAPKAILWLALECETQAKNLRKEAEKLGVASSRLVFAKRRSYEEHLGRYGIVDLALDTSPFNGGTTTSDALWGGAPVLTLCGETYANRMATSLIQNLGLEQLITHSFEEYESRLNYFLANPDELSDLKRQLENNKHKSTLFDTKRFVRHLESGLRLAVSRSKAGLQADHIDVQKLE